jgi:hypothetical protein
MRNLEPGHKVGTLGYKHGPALTLDGMKDLIEKDPGNKVHKERSLMAMRGVIYPLVVIKNPYSWHQSISRFRKMGFNFKSEYRQYNDNYKSWKTLLENPHKPFGVGVKIRYEDLLINAEKELNRICRQTGIGRSNDVLSVPDKVPQSDEFTEERRRFYLSDGNFGLSDEMVEEITNIIDWELMKFYGYKPIR